MSEELRHDTRRFLVADTQLYRKLCPSVGPSIRNAQVEKWKTSVLDVFLGRCVGGGAWGVDWGWMPLPTRPQQYCDPASLVLFALENYEMLKATRQRCSRVF